MVLGTVHTAQRRHQQAAVLQLLEEQLVSLSGQLSKRINSLQPCSRLYSSSDAGKRLRM